MGGRYKVGLGAKERAKLDQRRVAKGDLAVQHGEDACAWLAAETRDYVQNLNWTRIPETGQMAFEKESQGVLLHS